MQPDIADVERAAQYGPALVAGSQVIDLPEWRQIVTQDLPIPEVNAVVRSVLAEAEAPFKVAQAIESYTRRGLPMWWVVGPSSKPQDLSKLLVDHGMTLDHEAVGLVISAATEVNPSPEHVNVQEIDMSNLSDYWIALGRAPTEPLLNWGERMLAGEFGKISCFTAYLNGIPAGGAAYHILDDRMAYLMSGFTLPQFRNRGVYQALLTYRLQRLRRLSIPWAVTLAKTDTSAPLCMKMGFKETCRFKIYRKDIR